MRSEDSTVAGRFICDPVLELVGVPHGFAERGAQPPDSTVFTRQVHGIRAIRAEAARSGAPEEADALVSQTPGLGVGVVTADCVPLLVATSDGRRVAAIHAGWRGLAAGVIEAGIAALGGAPSGLHAAVGPAARGCCYEVDEPVVSAMHAHYPGLLEGGVLEPGRRAGRHQLDLPRLAARVLEQIGLAESRIGMAASLCTFCTSHNPGSADPRFESFRRDGASAGRLRHFVAPRNAAEP
jgi:polyphenol oxidase